VACGTYLEANQLSSPRRHDWGLHLSANDRQRRANPQEAHDRKAAQSKGDHTRRHVGFTSFPGFDNRNFSLLPRVMFVKPVQLIAATA
jgi:hypothetical protein